MLLKMWQIWLKNYPLFLRGTLLTLKISIVGTIVGLIIGLIVGIIRTIPEKKGGAGIFVKIIKKILGFYILFFRGTPDEGGSECDHSGKYMGTFPGRQTEGI